MTNESPKKSSNHDWKAIVAEHTKPSVARASWQIVNTVGSYIGLWILMYFAVSISWWLTVPLIAVTGAMLVRMFIIFHDCGHGSFFKSRRVNDIWGCITGTLTFTCYHHWRWEHSIHHASSGHLDKRGIGDIWTLTVQEYLEASRFKRIAYRLVRNPIVLFVIAPLYLFLVYERIPNLKAKRREVIAVLVVNVVLAGMVAGLIAIFGLWPYVIIQLGVLAIAGCGGIWLFYVQHQYEETYWERDDWDYATAALEGSSFYKLPRILQWFSGNIGFHHIHHLSPRVPNYNLERCHRSHPMFHEVKPLTLFGSLKSMSYRLWDEKARRLISFGQLKRQLRANGAQAA
ncbi:MAG: omega-6 fatty acid desaturase (delta-12 desaturase) [Verrucomicrobiales bacterium]|jgi:omega-6 fatty acid desaturase (delta-12 desaturase)